MLHFIVEKASYKKNNVVDKEVAREIRKKKRVKFEKDMHKLEENQKNIEQEIKKVVGIEKYKKGNKMLILGFLTLKEVSIKQEKKLSKIEGIAAVGSYNELDWKQFNEFREQKRQISLTIIDKLFTKKK